MCQGGDFENFLPHFGCFLHDSDCATRRRECQAGELKTFRQPVRVFFFDYLTRAVDKIGRDAVEYSAMPPFARRAG